MKDNVAVFGLPGIHDEEEDTQRKAYGTKLKSIKKVMSKKSGDFDRYSSKKSRTPRTHISKTSIADLNAIIDEDLCIDRQNKSKKVSAIMNTIDS